MIPYKRYRADLIKLGAKEIPSEAEYNRQYNIIPIEEVRMPNTAKIEPTLKAHERLPKKSKAAISRCRRAG